MSAEGDQNPTPTPPPPSPLPPPSTLQPGSAQIRACQLNLQHCKAATALLQEGLTSGLFGIALVQEPWVNEGKVKGLASKDWDLTYQEGGTGPRACVVTTKRYSALKVTKYCTRDLAVVMVNLSLGGGPTRVILASAYQPSDSIAPPPTRELEELINFCESSKTELIVGCDANSMHPAWGSSSQNARGTALLDFLAARSVEILNRGSMPTFVTSRCRAVIDITLATECVAKYCSNWKVDGEVTLSDHKRLSFTIQGTPPSVLTTAGRNPKATDWALYREALTARLCSPGLRLNSESSIEAESEIIHAALLLSYEEACPIKAKKAKKKVAWWSSELSGLRRQSRRLHNRAMRTSKDEDWAKYREAQSKFKKLIRSSKTLAWRRFCSELETVSTVAALRRIFSSGPPQSIGSIVVPSGDSLGGQVEILQHLLEVHFPDSVSAGYQEVAADTKQRPAEWRTARKVVDPEGLKWALNTFDRYKSPGPDGVFPALLQEGGDVLISRLLPLFRACLALGYIPKLWREVRVVFIPKPGKCSYDRAKDFRPISLTSFLMKAMERLVGRYIREGALAATPIHPSQHAYRAGRSTETALHNLVYEVEGAIRKKQATLCVFLDIEGAFDNTPFESIRRATERFAVDEPLIRWIQVMLRQRYVTSSFGSAKVRALVGKGCPQGGVLSPLLWLLVVDGLLAALEGRGVKTIGYADDVCVMISGDNLHELSSKMQRALCKVEEWCTSQGLRVNPGKTEMVLFTRKRKLRMERPTVFGARLQLSPQVKYLGIWLDAKLTWNKQVTYLTTKAKCTFWACRRMFSNTWGLKPAKVNWIYKAIVTPQITYASLVWWPALMRAKHRKALEGVFRLAGLGITGAFSTTPTAALGALLHLPPLHYEAERSAVRSAARLLSCGEWLGNRREGHASILKRNRSLGFLIGGGVDKCARTVALRNNVTTCVPTKEQWRTNRKELLSPEGMTWYTDGAKTGGSSGAGVWSGGPRTEVSLSLPGHATVLQTELAALRHCAELIRARNDRGKHIYICSDSVAAIGALKRATVETPLIKDCKTLLEQICLHNKVTVLWVPGHSGTEGNERAHELARQGLNAQGLPCHVGVSMGTINDILQKEADDLIGSTWREVNGLRHTKIMLKNPSRKMADLMLSLSRVDARCIVGLVTGHWFTRAHMSRIGLCQESRCPRCNLEEETPLHIIAHCPALDDLRFEVFDAVGFNDAGIEGLGIRKLLLYAERAGIRTPSSN